MFPHATKHPRGVRSSTRAMALVLTAIIALLVFLALPPGHTLAKSHAAADQVVPSSTPGTPTPNGTVSRGVGSVSYNNNLYVFVVGKGGHLWVDMWNGSSWQWADQGTPPGGVTVYTKGGVVSYSNNLYVYFAGSDGHLWVDMWNRSSWQWADQSTPPGSITVWEGAGAVSYSNNLYVFVVGTDYRLWVDYWNRTSWQWADQGTPA